MRKAKCRSLIMLKAKVIRCHSQIIRNKELENIYVIDKEGPNEKETQVGSIAKLL